MQELSLYIHIPFCRERCTYCAFNTYADMGDQTLEYGRALLKEVQTVASHPLLEGYQIHTMYFGGGTPSLLSIAQVRQIVRVCRESFALTDDVEISLEANPGTVDLQRLVGYRDAGIWRLSLGVQSAIPRDLQLLGRLHDFEEARAAFWLARRAGFASINVDLMYGLPYQTLTEWQETLEEVLRWEPDHLSMYSLSLEPGTPLYRQVQARQHPYPDPDLAADMYDHTRERLNQAGYTHYEISNWAREGHECLHNRQYWLNEPFLGVGAGAYGAINGVRYWNVRSIPDYISRLNAGNARAYVSAKRSLPVSAALYDLEYLDQTRQMAETLILGLRLLREGVSRVPFSNRFGVSIDEVFGPEIADMVSAGWLLDDGQTIRLAPRVYLLSNRVFARLLP